MFRLTLYEIVKEQRPAVFFGGTKNFLKSQVQKHMDLSGLEPLTSCLQSRRSTS